MVDKNIARASWLVFTLVVVAALTLFIELDSRRLARDFSFIEHHALRLLIIQNEIPFVQFPLSPDDSGFIHMPLRPLPLVGFSYCSRVNWQPESAAQIREFSDEPIFEGLKKIREKYPQLGGTNPEQFIPFKIITADPFDGYSFYNRYHFAAVKVNAESPLEFWDLNNGFATMIDTSGESASIISRAGRYGIVSSDFKAIYLTFRSKLVANDVNVPVLGITVEQTSAFLALSILGVGLSILLLNSLRLLLNEDLSKRSEPWVLLDSATVLNSSGLFDKIGRIAEIVGTWLFHMVAAWAAFVLSILAVINYFPPLATFKSDFYRTFSISAGLVLMTALSLVISIKITEYMWKLHISAHEAQYQAAEASGWIATAAGIGIGAVNGLVGIYLKNRRFKGYTVESASAAYWASMMEFLLSLFILIGVGIVCYFVIKNAKGRLERSFTIKASILWLSCTLGYLIGCWLISPQTVYPLILVGIIAPLFGIHVWRKTQLKLRERNFSG